MSESFSLPKKVSVDVLLHNVEEPSMLWLVEAMTDGTFMAENKTGERRVVFQSEGMVKKSGWRVAEILGANL